MFVGIVQCSYDKLPSHAVTHGHTYKWLSAEVHNQSLIEPAFIARDASNTTNPFLAPLFGMELTIKQILGHWERVI